VSKKKKFDLTHLVHHGLLQNGQALYYVSDPSLSCTVTKQPNGEFKVVTAQEKETITVFAFVQRCLGQEPPDHASKWLRTDSGKTLYDLWHSEDAVDDAA